MSALHLLPGDSPPGTRGILVTDFDGTITSGDFFELVRARWPLEPDPWEEALAGRLTMREALRQIFAGARGSEAEFLGLADQLGVGPETGEAFRDLTRNGWRVVVASSGCTYYIRHVLARVGAHPEILAHPGTFVEGQGLFLDYDGPSPFAHPRFGLDKSAVVRHFVDRGLPVYFAGDGTPDLDALLLLPPDRRFATGWAAGQLHARGETFRPFTRWPEMADLLLAQG